MNMNVTYRILIPSLLVAFPCLMFGADGGGARHGFRLLEKRFVKELNAECFYFEHIFSGAKLFKIAAADPNKTFGIIFRTVADSDSGTPHILEHSVLSGSRNFPVKSPFNILMKGGSLATFLNAMTGDDYTVYPAASMNTKDYFNLMRVYLDAVFHPLIYSNATIFQREGWHYEMAAKDAPLTYNGVVYNEMKGGYSNPTRELYRQMVKGLFPDTPYHYDSGGDPTAIPALTREAFLDFHRRYYHPSNAYIFLYGDAELGQELAELDKVLSEYPKQDKRLVIAPQAPFVEVKKVTASYAVADGTASTGQSYLSQSWVTGSGTDVKLNMELDILADALVGNESAPLRQALRQAGIGKEYQAGTSGNSIQSVFQIVARNANPNESEKFHQVVTKTLRAVAENGFDAEMIEGIVNRMEFHLRENNDARKGLKYGFSMLSYWMATGNPFLGLEYENDLADVKKSIKNGILKKLVKKLLLDNPHSLLLTLNPELGLEKKRDDEMAASLAKIQAKFTSAEREKLVSETQELVEEQKRKDSPEALAKVPMLDRGDLNAKALWYAIDKNTLDGVPVLHYDTFTNSVVYLRLYFDLRRVPEPLLPYVALLRDIQGRVDTEQYRWGELDNRLNRDTGGWGASIDIFMEHRDDHDLVPQFTVNAKTLAAKLPQTFDLLAQIIGHSRYTDAVRMKELLARIQSGLEAQLKSDGVGCAMGRIVSYYSRRGVLDGRLGRMEYYRFIKKLNAHYDAQASETIAKLEQVSKLLFSRGNLVAAATCGKSETADFNAGLKTFIRTLPEGAAKMEEWTLTPVKKNEALLAASQVQFVVQGGNFKQAGYAWNGRMRLLSHIISRDWLWNRLREIGGAYGGYCIVAPDGNVMLVSYRDPKLKETFANFKETPEYLNRLKLSDEELTRYLIGTVATVDSPLNPSAEGDLAFRRYFENVSQEEIQRERDELLSAKPDDIRAFAKMIEDILKQGNICVYGNESKLKDNKELFGELIEIMPK